MTPHPPFPPFPPLELFRKFIRFSAVTRPFAFVFVVPQLLQPVHREEGPLSPMEAKPTKWWKGWELCESGFETLPRWKQSKKMDNKQCINVPISIFWKGRKHISTLFISTSKMIISGGTRRRFSGQPGLQLLPTSKLPASPFGWTLSTDFLGYFFVLKQWDPISNVSQIQMSMASNSLRYCNSIRWQVSNGQCWIICGLEWLEEHCGQASPTQNACRTEIFLP